MNEIKHLPWSPLARPVAHITTGDLMGLQSYVSQTGFYAGEGEDILAYETRALEKAAAETSLIIQDMIKCETLYEIIITFQNGEQAYKEMTSEDLFLEIATVMSRAEKPFVVDEAFFVDGVKKEYDDFISDETGTLVGIR